MIEQTVRFLGALVGVFLRTWLPARRKALKLKRLGKEFKWKTVYVKTAVASFFVAAIAALLVLPGISISTADLAVLFGSSMAVGFASNGISNEIYDLLKGEDDEQVSVPEGI